MNIKILKRNINLVQIEISNLNSDYSDEDILGFRLKFASVASILVYEPTLIVFEFHPSNKVFQNFIDTFNLDNQSVLNTLLIKEIIEAPSSLDMLYASNHIKNVLHGEGFFYFSKNDENRIYYYIDKELFISFFKKTSISIFDIFDVFDVNCFLTTKTNTSLLNMVKFPETYCTNVYVLSVPNKDFMTELKEFDLDNMLRFMQRDLIQ